MKHTDYLQKFSPLHNKLEALQYSEERLVNTLKKEIQADKKRRLYSRKTRRMTM